MILGQLVVVDAVNDSQVRAFRRGGNEDALRACLQVGRRLLARGEDARAFERDVDAERLMRKLGRIPDRGDLDLMAVHHDRVALDADLMGKPPMDAVVAQEVRVGLHRAQIVNGDDLNVLAAGLHNSAQHKPPNPAEAVDRYLGNHLQSLLLRRAPPHGPADASKLKSLKARLLSDPRPMSTVSSENAAFSFDPPQKRARLVPSEQALPRAMRFPKPGRCAGERPASRDRRRKRLIAKRAYRSRPR